MFSLTSPLGREGGEKVQCQKKEEKCKQQEEEGAEGIEGNKDKRRFREKGVPKTQKS